MRTLFYYLMTFVAGFGSGLLVSVFWLRSTPPPAPTPQIDTLVVVDTVTITKPEYIVRRVVDSIPFFVIDTLKVHDTTVVYLPKEEKVYEDSTYRAVVSGYEPSLDTIAVYPKTTVIKQTEVVEVPMQPRWSIGVQGGVGVMVNDKGFHAGPYIGIGIQYNLINFKCQSTKCPAATNGEAPGKSIPQGSKQNGKPVQHTHRDTVRNLHTNQLKNKSYDN